MAAVFFVFIYHILYDVGKFFGVDRFILQMYFVWVGVIIILITLLPTRLGDL
jgi:hypothetical protein